ncbi:MAG: hypothetical protein DHS20C18_40320 [Saprospiraceae bacterium]|nr:MAG: hypothetical protein DHS20C18_40320 [Saprospiraceae bacterium]
MEKKDKPTFETFIQDKFRDQSFDFKEEYWVAANAKFTQLKKEKKERQRKLFLFFLLGFFLLVVLLHFMFKSSQEQNHPKRLQMVDSQVMANTVTQIQDTIECLDLPLNDENFESLKKVLAFSQDAQDVPHKLEVNKNYYLDAKKLDSLEIETDIKTNVQKEENLPSLKASSLPSIEPLSFHSKDDELFILKEDLNRSTYRWSMAFELFAGNGISKSYKDVSTSEATFLINYHFKPDWRLSAGIGYKLITGRLPIGVSEQVSYGFIATTTRYEWNLRNLHYFSIPFQIEYSPVSRHSFTAGGSLYCQVKTAGNLIVYQNTTFQSDELISEKGDVDYGTSIPRWMFDLKLGYRYQLNKNLGTGLQLRIHPDRLVKSKYFDISNFGRPTFVGVFLQYRF